MANEPLPHQMTVAQLRELLEDAQENAVVALRLPAGYTAASQIPTFVNLKVEGKTTGPVLVLTPSELETTL
ncbi:MAG: hypothetical protein ACRYFS_08450 [Janthinobacterium lividum]